METQLNADRDCHPQEFPNLSRAFTALLTLPITTATAESSFNALRRSTIKEGRLSGLAPTLFLFLLQIQLTTHTISSLEGLICLVYYRVTLGAGLQQFTKLATLLITILKIEVWGGSGARAAITPCYFLKHHKWKFIATQLKVSRVKYCKWSHS